MGRLGAGAGSAYPGQPPLDRWPDYAAYVTGWLDAEGLVPVLETLEAYCRQCKEDATQAKDVPRAALWGHREGFIRQTRFLVGAGLPPGAVTDG